MIKNNYEKVKRLCSKLYGTNAVKKFADTLHGEDKRILLALLDGKEEEKTDEVLLKCLQILSVRSRHKNSPYGFYHKH